MKLKVDDDGQVRVPEELVQELGLAPGAKVHAEKHGNEIHLIPEQSQQSLLQYNEHGVLVFTGELSNPAVDVGKVLRRMRRKRDKRLGGMES